MPLQEVPLKGPPPVRPGRDYEALFGDGHGNPAYGAFEMALFDLVGRALGVPAHWLLGGAVRDRVPADYWIGQQNPADAARNARRGQERGFHGMKLKCAVDDPWEERVGAILEACGPDFKLTLDPNERFYRPAEAIALAKRLERFPNIALYEDPMPKWNLDWYRQFRAAVTAPVALHLAHPRDVVLAIKAEACDHFNLAGSMVQFVRSAAMAAAYGALCWHGSGVDLGIMEHSYLHAAACARNCVLPSDLVGSWVREDDLVTGGLRFEDGCAVLPATPAWGASWTRTRSSAMRSPDGRAGRDAVPCCVRTQCDFRGIVASELGVSERRDQPTLAGGHPELDRSAWSNLDCGPSDGAARARCTQRGSA